MKQRILLFLGFVGFLALGFQNCQSKDLGSEVNSKINVSSPSIENESQLASSSTALNLKLDPENPVYLSGSLGFGTLPEDLTGNRAPKSNAQTIERPIVLEVKETLGTMAKGQHYILWHDSATQLDHLSLIAKDGMSAAYPAAQYNQSVRNLWGVSMTQGNLQGMNCLIYQNRCFAQVLDVLFPSHLTSAATRFYGFIQDMQSYLSIANQQVLGQRNGDIATCPGKPTVILNYLAIRNLALFAKYSSRAYPYIFDSNQKQNMRLRLLDSFQTLSQLNPFQLLQGSYMSCYGGSESQTLQMTLSGLSEIQKVLPGTIPEAFSKEAWTQLLNLGLIENIRQDVLQRAITVPNGFAQYLTYSTLLQSLGHDTVQGDFTTKGIEALFARQTLTSSQVEGCQIQASYGGWTHHKPEDCSQKVGYHVFILEGIMDIDRYSRSYCSHPYWKFTCDNTRWNLLAGLTWLTHLQNPQGAFWDQAPGAYVDRLSEWGTAFAISVGFETLSYLRFLGFSESQSVKINFDGSTTTLKDIRTRLENGMIWDAQAQLVIPLHYGDYLSYRISELYY